MARDAMRQVQAFQWQQRPDEPAERDIAVDPFSLRQFSRLDIDRPLPIPSVSFADPHVSPARFGASGSGSFSSAASSPRVSIAGRLNALAEATGWDEARAAASSPVPPAVAPPTKGKSTEELAADDDGGFDVALSSSGRKASEPQRWGSDVPLMSAATGADDEDSAGYYSFPNAARGRNGRGKARGDAPVGCCMYVPGLSRRNSKPPTPRRPPARSTSSSSSSGKAAAFGFATAATTTAAVEKRYAAAAEDTVTEEDPAAAPGDTARQSTVSLAVSLERFDCGSLSTSSWGDLDLDGEDVSYSSRFDLLPLELILGCDDGDGDEADMPVCAAFVFDSDGVRRSVLKKRIMVAAGGAGEEEEEEEARRRPSLGRASMSSMNASGRMSARYGRVSLKSRSPPPPKDALAVDVVDLL